jgi:NADH:ubiquinone oxidoreductase subunit 3 (subunit A)
MYLYIKILIIIGIILLLSTNINKSTKNREKLTIYECGYQEYDDTRKNFYIKYFLIAIIFLIFDLETLLLFPLSLFLPFLTFSAYSLFNYLIFLLSIGLAFEINKFIILH